MPCAFHPSPGRCGNVPQSLILRLPRPGEPYFFGAANAAGGRPSSSTKYPSPCGKCVLSRRKHTPTFCSSSTRFGKLLFPKYTLYAIRSLMFACGEFSQVFSVPMRKIWERCPLAKLDILAYNVVIIFERGWPYELRFSENFLYQCHGHALRQYRRVRLGHCLRSVQFCFFAPGTNFPGTTVPIDS